MRPTSKQALAKSVRDSIHLIPQGYYVKSSTWDFLQPDILEDIPLPDELPSVCQPALHFYYQCVYLLSHELAKHSEWTADFLKSLPYLPLETFSDKDRKALLWNKAGAGDMETVLVATAQLEALLLTSIGLRLGHTKIQDLID